MSIPKYRHIEYTDDGCNLYECLNCYKKFETRSVGFTYCSYCGCKFEGGEQWLEMDDDYNIITPARMRKDRRVPAGTPSWHVSLQERHLIKCQDGIYAPAYDGTFRKDEWNDVHNTDYFFDHIDPESRAEKACLYWRSLCEDLKNKYGYRYGYFIYAKKIIEKLFEMLRENKDLLFFHSGCDYRVRFEKYLIYNETLEERHVDLGGWRELEDKTYTIRKPNTTFEMDDLDANWKDHFKE